MLLLVPLSSKASNGEGGVYMSTSAVIGTQDEGSYTSLYTTIPIAFPHVMTAAG